MIWVVKIGTAYFAGSDSSGMSERARYSGSQNLAYRYDARNIAVNAAWHINHSHLRVTIVEDARVVKLTTPQPRVDTNVSEKQEK